MKNQEGEIIYVGKAVKLKNRLRCYFGNNSSLPSVKVAMMVEKIVDFEYLLCENEKEALILESSLIKRYRPFYNVLLKDDHDYPYIRVTLNQAWPRVERAYRVYDDKLLGAKYYGPYMHGALTKALRTLEQLFPLASCNPDKLKPDVPKRPCLNYQIGKCIGTCAGVATKEDYLAVIAQVCQYLNGDIKGLETTIMQKMQAAVAEQAFEEAAFWRDRLQNLQNLQTEQRIVSDAAVDADVIAVAAGSFLYCIQKLEIRQGKIVGSACFFIKREDLQYTLFAKQASGVTPTAKVAATEAETVATDAEMAGTALGPLAHNLEDLEAASLCQLFITQHYENMAYIPKQIYFNRALAAEEQENLSAYLAKAAEHKVKLTVPKKGESLKWVQMAAQNAEEALVKKNILNSTKQLDVYAALSSLQQYLHLEQLPQRIEAFDVANLGNDYLCCAMAVFVNGVYQKSASCLFKIRNQDSQDDYLAMSEALVRRMRYLLRAEADNLVNAKLSDFVSTDKANLPNKGSSSLYQKPDLILLDGSKGHRHAVLQALERAYAWSLQPQASTIAIGGMVKDNKHRTRALLTDKEELIELQAALHDREKMTLLRFLTQIQDAVHRLANNYYRILQRKKVLHYELEDIPGIGPAKRTKLLAAFKSLQNIKNASLSELLEKGKLNKVDASAVYNYYHLHGADKP